MSTPHAIANQTPRGRPPRTAVAMPYFTSQDPALMRALSNRDPLGFLPIWSAFARRLVPNVASPVGQINGIRAVLLILWLSNQREIEAALFKGKDARRHFFRLMEGLIEYWLMSSGRAYCYGANTLNASGDAFALTIQSGKTVANGLYQYYRGTCRRAGFVDNDWLVSGEIGAALQAQWSPAATRALIAALDAPLTFPADRNRSQITSLRAIHDSIHHDEQAFSSSSAEAGNTCSEASGVGRSVSATCLYASRVELSIFSSG
ncbi:hypothetical protein [Burkholderia cepacia]|uniref:hypothetical protein n=1 Tax=Burkholderia cepacia TaxID=292 RepID=UPI001FC838B3|nr:hypothetical protein [Burkholderia cepacia]